MPRTRPPYGPEFWTQAITLTREPGNTVKSVARDLGVSYEGLRRYVRQAEIDPGRRPASPATSAPSSRVFGARTGRCARSARS